MSSFAHLFALALLAAPAAAAEARNASAVAVPRAEFVAQMDREFRSLDANGDGSATKSELTEAQARVQAAAAEQRSNQLFSHLDKDRDGRLSPAEFARLAERQTNAAADPAPLLARFDVNKDSKISLVEYRKTTQANFDRIDADGDGVASTEELEAAGLVK